MTARYLTIKLGTCPHLIWVPEHYRDDGTCRCNDPDAKEMAAWGYRWNEQTRKWE